MLYIDSSIKWNAYLRNEYNLQNKYSKADWKSMVNWNSMVENTLTYFHAKIIFLFGLLKRTLSDVLIFQITLWDNDNKSGNKAFQQIDFQTSGMSDL